MKTPETKGTWKEKKAKLRLQFGFLTDNDLMFESAKNDDLLEKLHLKLGKTKEELRKIIAAL